MRSPFHDELDALYAAGHWLLTEGRPEDAVVIFRAMVDANERDERAWLALGVCHEDIAQPEMAMLMYDAGVEVAWPAPRCAIAKARLLRKADDDDAADEVLEIALEHALALEDDDLARLARVEMGR